MAEGGRPTERLRLYHAAKARGGCALTIVGGSSSVHPSPAAAWKQIANYEVLTAIRRRVGRDFVVGAIARRLAVLDGIRAARAI
jgi:2,4-dienoyl-CoA reductase-like NADH-dependent reductase (Old Yellow Enzyme family)